MSHDPGTGEVLLRIARAAIARELGHVYPVAEDAQWLREPGASFVTLRHEERLRGCIGTLKAHRPLIEDVKANARNAAFRDPRFPPLSAGEFERTLTWVIGLDHPEPFAAVHYESPSRLVVDVLAPLP